MEDRLAIVREARGAIHQSTLAHRGPGRAAEMAQAARALLALVAAGSPGQRHALADLQSRPGADCLDHAGTLVAQDRRARRLRGAVDRVLIGVADTAPIEPHQHLPLLGVGEIDLQHLEGTPGRGQHGSADLHVGRSPGSAGRISRRAAACAARRSECGSASRGRAQPRPAAAHSPRRCP